MVEQGNTGIDLLKSAKALFPCCRPGWNPFSESIIYGDIIEHLVETITELAGQCVSTVVSNIQRKFMNETDFALV